MPEESFTARNAALTEQIIRARRAGDRAAAERALEELLERYTKLGERRAGTDEEQNSYIVARRLGSMPAELTELGVDDSNLPLPPSRRAAAPPPAAAADVDVDESRIVSRFARIRADDQNDEQDPRYHVDYRPQDNMRYQGRLLPYAVVDQEDGLPVGWYPDNDWADWIADTASRMREAS